MLAASWKRKDKSFMFLFLSTFLTGEEKKKKEDFMKFKLQHFYNSIFKCHNIPVPMPF